MKGILSIAGERAHFQKHVRKGEKKSGTGAVGVGSGETVGKRFLQTPDGRLTGYKFRSVFYRRGAVR